ncbi:recombinase family protein [Nevskia sp.]|uniref:recombinase family protein n=1 Tax=Nevskia sp. TaxID=1929292 RepID=UPI003F72A7D1
MRPTAVIYARVSTAKQAAEELPLTSQVEQCRAKAEALGVEVLRVFEDRGISGRDEDRPGFQDAIAFAESQRCAYFITWSTSRFARDAVHAGVYKRRLEKRGVRMAYCTADIDRGTTSGFVLDTVLAMIDEVVSRQVATDTLRSLQNNARAGHWNGGRVPFGYSAGPAPDDPRRRRLVPRPEEAWIVTAMFRRCAEGAGPRTIASDMNASGTLHRGKPWTSAAVAHVLESPSSAGMVVFNRRAPRQSGTLLKPESEWIRVQSHQPIIDPDLWERVQALRASARRKKLGHALSTHLFTGVLACGHCGAQMNVERATGRTASYAYYNCRSWIASKGCGDRRRRADKLDAWLVAEICDKVFTAETMTLVAMELNAACGTWAAERRSELAAIERELRDIAERRRRLLDVLELHGRDAPDLGDMKDRLTELRERERSLKERREARSTEAAPTFGADAAEIGEIRSELLSIVRDATDVPRSRSMLRQLLESVVLHSDRAEINYRTDLLADNRTQTVPVHSSANWLPDQDSNLGPSD